MIKKWWNRFDQTCKDNPGTALTLALAAGTAAFGGSYVLMEVLFG